MSQWQELPEASLPLRKWAGVCVLGGVLVSKGLSDFRVPCSMRASSLHKCPFPATGCLPRGQLWMPPVLGRGRAERLPAAAQTKAGGQCTEAGEGESLWQPC